MDHSLRLGKALCPYLKTTPARQLRALSTAPAAGTAKPQGARAALPLAASVLYAKAQTCPVMGSALAVRSESQANNTKSSAPTGARKLSTTAKCPFPHDTTPAKAAHVDSAGTKFAKPADVKGEICFHR